MAMGEQSTIEFRNSPDTELAWLRETGIPASMVLSGLSFWGSFDRMVQFAFPKPIPGPPNVTRRRLLWEDVKTGAEYALSKIQEGAELSPPALTAVVQAWATDFVASLIREGRSIDPSLASALEDYSGTVLRAKLGTVRQKAEVFLASLAGMDVRENDSLASAEIEKQALHYAAVLVRGGRLPAGNLHHPEDERSFIRDAVSEQVRVRLFDCSVYLSESSGHRVTPESLFRQWERRVSKAETESDGEYMELYLDLQQRDKLEEMLLLVPPTEYGPVGAIIRPVDERYEQATDPVDAPIYGRAASWARVSWWWYRIPKRRGPKLEREFLSSGVISS